MSASWLKNQVPEKAELLNLQKLSQQRWQLIDGLNWEWEPKLQGAVIERVDYLQKGATKVAIYQANFGREQQEAELVNSQHLLIGEDQSERWKLIESKGLNLTLAQGENFQVVQSVLTGNGKALVVWRWYKVGQHSTDNDYYAKGFQLLKRLMANTEPEIQMISFIESPYDDYKQARADLLMTVSDWQKN